MADNITIKDGGGTNVTLGAKDVGSVFYPQSTPVTPAGVTLVGTAGTAAAGTLTIQGIASGTPVIVSDGSGALSVDDAGGSLTVDGSVSISGTATVSVGDSWVQVDDAAFTPATSKIAMVGATFDDVAPDSVNEGDGGAIRMSANRNLYATLRDAAGNERGMNIDANGDHGVTARSGAFAAGALASGSIASGAIASGAIATGAFAAGAASIADNEDAGSADGDRGVKVLFKRLDTPANSSGSDADYEQPQMSAGRLWTSTTVTSQVPGTGATNLGKAEDAGHSSGDVGVMALAVRNDTAAALATTTLDYIPITTNARGASWVAIEDGAGGQITSFGGGTQYTEDAAAAANPVGTSVTLIREDARAGSLVTTDADNVAQRGNNFGDAYVIGPHTTKVSATFNRPGDTNSYAANDAVSDNTTAGSVTKLSWTIPYARGTIRRVKIRKSDQTVATPTLRLFLWDATFAVGAGDNAAFANPYQDAIGIVDVPVTTAGSDDAVGWAPCDIPFSGGTLFGLLQTLSVFAPANSETFTIDLTYYPG